MAIERQIKISPLRGHNRQTWRCSWLLASTALSAVLAHPLPARAQSLSATAIPQGGTVVGGRASITQSIGSTTITQNSSRAAINWHSYNVGSDAHVTYLQPSSSAVMLNRVVSPSPSVIAGHISANGQLVLINQSGVVFTKGAEVTAQSVIVSTSNISNSDFMAGKMNFTGTPNPGAKIVNDGKITAGEAGLVGLVAPQVANDGIITARLGQVVLAGADAFTLDLYGDKLVSLDVTRAVREVNLNGKIVPALVTNKGLILADGGKITLTAADADALVSQLLQVGGTLRANNADGQAGTISLQAVGGGINIAGNLLAQGTPAGNIGGKVEAVATDTVSVASHAVIDASGQAGGGTIALGTNLQRAAEGASDTNAPQAAVVNIASGAQIEANATAQGNGGKVTLLSSESTALQGTISSTGGTLGGNGGNIEISSEGVISLGGTVIDTAIDGQAGEILLDPQTLIVTSTTTTSAGTTSSGTGSSLTTTFGTDTSKTSYVDAADLSSLSGTITLEASKLISIASAITNSSASLLNIVSSQDLTITASVSLTGSLDINAAGTLNVAAPLNASTITLVDSGTSSTIGINGVITGTELLLTTSGTIAEGSTGGVNASTLSGSVSGNAWLAGTQNSITTLADFTTGGTLNLADLTSLVQTGTASGTNVTLSADGLSLNGTASATNVLALESSAGVTQATTGFLIAKTLTTGTATIFGDVNLSGTANAVGTLGFFGSTGTLALANSTDLAITDTVSASGVSLAANGTLGISSVISAATGGDVALAAQAITVNGGSIAAPSGIIALAPYGNGTLDVGGSTAGGLILSSALLGVLDTSASVLNLGSADGYTASLAELEGTISLRPTLNLSSTGQLIQSGKLNAPSVTLSAATPKLNGTIIASSLSLASGNITQASTGALNVSNLSGSGSSVQLLGTNNISALDGLSATGNIFINDAGTMTLDGAVSAGTSLGLTAPNLTFVNTVSGGQISLTADSITDNGGAVHAPGGMVSISPYTAGLAVDLGGNAAGLDLSGTLLGAITAAALNISTQGSIIAEGSAILATPLLSLAANGITFSGTLNTPGTLALSSGAGVVSTATDHLNATTLLTNGVVSGDILLNQGNNSIGTLGSVALSNGNLTLTDTSALLVSGPISANAINLSASSLTLDGHINTGTLALFASNGLSETGGTLDAATLTGSVIGNATLNGGINNIGTLLNISDNGSLILADTSALTQAGSLAASNVFLNAAGLNFMGTLITPGTLGLAGSGNFLQTDGSLGAAMLSSIGTVNGNISLTQTGNLLPNVQNLAATGTINLASGGVLGQSGALSAAALTLTAPSLALNGTVSTPGPLQLNGGGVSEGSGGVINTALLTTGGNLLSGNAVFNNPANRITSLGDFTADGGLNLADGAALSINGPVSLSGTLALTDASNIIQTASTICAAALTSNGDAIGGSANFGQSDNTIPVLGNFTAHGNLLLNTSDAITLAGNVNTGGTLSLDSGGTIGQSGGFISAARLNASGTAIDLSGTNVGLLGNISSPGDVSIANAGGLAGTLVAQNATLGSNGVFAASGGAQIKDALYINASGSLVQVGGILDAQTATISAPSITLSGTTDITNALALFASGNVLHEAGSLRAAKLVGTAGQLAEFGAFTDVSTLGSFLMNDSLFALNNAGPLTLIGPLAANAVSITAAGALTLEGNANGGLFLSGNNITRAATRPRTGIDSVLAVTGANPIITQNGIFYIDAGPNLTAYLGNASPLATLFMSLASSGAIELSTAPGLLNAPNTALVLAAGLAGLVSGNVSVQYLEILSAQSVQMTGAIGAISGPTAAGKGSAFPFPEPSYRFNTCPIGSVNCTILPIEGLPQANPLQNFDLSPHKRRRLDKNVTLPGVAARDF